MGNDSDFSTARTGANRAARRRGERRVANAAKAGDGGSFNHLTKGYQKTSQKTALTVDRINIRLRPLAQYLPSARLIRRGNEGLEDDMMSAMEKPDMTVVPKTVLIVEDNELNMKLFHDLLEVQGYNIVEARTGPEALKSANEHRPDLILMDIQLPEVSGLEVTKKIKENPELDNIPVIAVTAFAMKGDEERIRQGGCEDYIAKPISVASFLEKVKRYLD